MIDLKSNLRSFYQMDYRHFFINAHVNPFPAYPQHSVYPSMNDDNSIRLPSGSAT